MAASIKKRRHYSSNLWASDKSASAEEEVWLNTGIGKVWQRAGQSTTLDARWPNSFRWAWKRLANTVFENYGFVTLWHRLVHHRTVTIALDVWPQPLERIAPGDIAYLLGCDFPSAKALELMHGVSSILIVCEIDKGISKARKAEEVHGDIDKVVAALEALTVQEREQHIARVAVGHVAEHHGCKLMY